MVRPDQPLLGCYTLLMLAADGLLGAELHPAGAAAATATALPGKVLTSDGASWLVSLSPHAALDVKTSTSRRAA